MACNIISPSIAALINKSLTSSHFPNQLKLAKVFPIFENGSKSDPSNYRPISILPTISKIFEKHVNKHLLGYLNKYKLIHECQSGFRHKHSCQTALVKLIDQWMYCISLASRLNGYMYSNGKSLNVALFILMANHLAWCNLA